MEKFYEPGPSGKTTSVKHYDRTVGHTAEACYTTKSGITGCANHSSSGDYGGKACYTTGKTQTCVYGGSGDGGNVGVSFGFKF